MFSLFKPFEPPARNPDLTDTIEGCQSLASDDAASSGDFDLRYPCAILINFVDDVFNATPLVGTTDVASAYEFSC